MPIAALGRPISGATDKGLRSVGEMRQNIVCRLFVGVSTNELKNYFLILGVPPQLSPPMPVPFLPYGEISVRNPMNDAFRLPLESKLTVKVLNST